MDTTQLLLTVVLSVSTILLIVIGIQLIFVLREIRFTLKRVNAIVDGFENLGLSLEHSLGEMFGFATAAKTLFKTLDLFTNKKNGKFSK
jgi:hypothetical protein